MDLLTEAFAEAPLFQYAFPRARFRRMALHALFSALLDDAMRCGRVHAAFAQRLTGVLLWYPPGKYPMSLYRELRGLPKYLAIIACAPLGLARLYRVQATLDKLRPKQPHCHAYFLAGRGAGVASALGREMFAEADANGWPVYLETQDERTVNLYLRLGFEVVRRDIETLPGGPPTWTMWRAPVG